MENKLLSVGLDVGTTTTQLILSRLTVENKASSFAVPEMDITGREIIYRGAVHMTPLLDERHVDGAGVGRIVEQEYRQAGIHPKDVDTGAIIITGESSRKENAAAVLEAVSAYAGEFVVTTAGPDLESVLAAKGAGAVEESRQSQLPVLHMDIGGGTSNLALVENGVILRTGCLNIGGRLLKFQGGKVTYVSPVLMGLTDLRPGDYPREYQVEAIAGILTSALEMAAGLRPATALLEKLQTKEAGKAWEPPQGPCRISFSGGVADCIEKKWPPRQFSDMGPQLGIAIGKSLLCREDYRLGAETIRATVIGAGCHSAQLSGSTVFVRDVALPLKNLPVITFTRQEQDSPELPALIRSRLAQLDEKQAVLAMPGYEKPDYRLVQSLAHRIAEGFGGGEILVCLEADMAKALGQCIWLAGGSRGCLCIDRVRLSEGSFLDIGAPVGPALPVVVKTLVLEKSKF